MRRERSWWLVAGGWSVKRLCFFDGRGVQFGDVPSVSEIASAWSSISSMDGAVPALTRLAELPYPANEPRAIS